jgi:malonyl-CoA O-methyltransferase
MQAKPHALLMPAQPLPIEPFFTDPLVVRRHATRSADTFDAHAVLHREVASRMNERLDYIKITPHRILDLGCATGGAQPLLAARYPHAQRVALDFALPRVQRAAPHATFMQKLRRQSVSQGVCADMQALPFAPRSFNLVWSNLALHWLNDPKPAIHAVFQTLDVGGLLMFTCLGPDTLKELRHAFKRTAPPPTHRPDHLHRFVDLHDIGDLLIGAGFATPVMDVETITLTYASVEALVRDLRATGSHNATHNRPRGLARTAARTLQAQLPHAADGRFSASFEVIYGHAWKPEPKRTSDGASIVRFQR